MFEFSNRGKPDGNGFLTIFEHWYRQAKCYENQVLDDDEGAKSWLFQINQSTITLDFEQLARLDSIMYG